LKKFDVRNNPIFAIPQYWKDLKTIEFLSDSSDNPDQIAPKSLGGITGNPIVVPVEKKLRSSTTAKSKDKKDEKKERRGSRIC